MRSLISFFVFLFAAAVSALSTTGNRLLVILDDVVEKANYSKFLADLESALVPTCAFSGG
jgi:oligosaccharyltransferase complex subunit beta